MRTAVVENGDTMDTFCERHGVSVEDVVRVNDRRLQDQAQVRGLTHAFVRHHGVQERIEYHVFAGEELELPA